MAAEPPEGHPPGPWALIAAQAAARSSARQAAAEPGRRAAAAEWGDGAAARGKRARVEAPAAAAGEAAQPGGEETAEAPSASASSASAPSASAPSAAARVTTSAEFWRVQLEAVYRRRNPYKLAGVAQLLRKYSGREATLYRKVCLAYDLDPTRFYADAAAWDDDGAEEEGAEEGGGGWGAAAAGLSWGLGLLRRGWRAIAGGAAAPGPAPPAERAAAEVAGESGGPFRFRVDRGAGPAFDGLRRAAPPLPAPGSVWALPDGGRAPPPSPESPWALPGAPLGGGAAPPGGGAALPMSGAPWALPGGAAGAPAWLPLWQYWDAKEDRRGLCRPRLPDDVDRDRGA